MSSVIGSCNWSRGAYGGCMVNYVICGILWCEICMWVDHFDVSQVSCMCTKACRREFSEIDVFGAFWILY